MRMLHSLLALSLAVTSTAAFEVGPFTPNDGIDGMEFDLSDWSQSYWYPFIRTTVTVLQEPRADGKWRNLWRVKQDGNVGMPAVWLGSYDNRAHLQIKNQYCNTNYELQIGETYVIQLYQYSDNVEFRIWDEWQHVKYDSCKIYDYDRPSQSQATLVVKLPKVHEPPVATIHELHFWNYKTWTTLTEEDFKVWDGSWELVASGSGPSGSVSFSIAKGVEFADGTSRTVTDGFQSSTSSSISQKTKHTVHATAKASVGGLFAKASVEAGYKYENEKGYTFGTSSTTSSSLAKTVRRSITEYQETTGTQWCGGEGRQYIYQYVLNNTHAEIFTTHFSCRPSATQPSCPPLRCKDEYCDTCLEGTFEDPEIDRIASTLLSPTQADESNAAAIGGAFLGVIAGLALLAFVYYKWRHVRSVKEEPLPVAESADDGQAVVKPIKGSATALTQE